MIHRRCSRCRSHEKEGRPMGAVATVADLRRAVRRASELRGTWPKRGGGLLQKQASKDESHVDRQKTEVLNQVLFSATRMQVLAQRARLPPRRRDSRAEPRRRAFAWPSTSHVGRLVPSVEESLNKFWTDELSSDDLLRLRVVFRSMSEDGLHVPRAALRELSVRLGLRTVSPDRSEELLRQITNFDNIDFQDFCDFCERALVVERQAFQRLLQTWDPNPGDNFVGAIEHVQGFMRSLQVVCSRKTVQDILDLAGLKDQPCDTSQEILRFLAAHHSCDGFNHQELAGIVAAFDACEEERPNPGPEGRLAKSSAVDSALLRFGGIYFVEEWRKVKKKLKARGLQHSSSNGICFFEFLFTARRIRERELRAVADEFDALDTDRDGLISVEALRALCQPLGFTLVGSEMTEFCKLRGVSEDSFLNVEAAWDFVQQVRNCHGFAEVEREELLHSFLRFSGGSGELATVKVMELLQWLGLEGNIEEARDMLRMVDFNFSGTLDQVEFLRLMRLQKEKNLKAYTRAYVSKSLDKDLSESHLVAALADCAVHPERQTLQEVFRRQKWKPGDLPLTWEAWVCLAEEVRKMAPVWKRRRAGFSEIQVRELQAAFRGPESVPGKTGPVVVSDLLWMLLDSGMRIHRAEERREFHQALDRARQEALEAGISPKDVGELGSLELYFAPFLHLVRAHVRVIEQQQIQREELAMRSVSFSAEEIADLRCIFNRQAQEAQEKEAKEAPAVCHPLSGAVLKLCSISRLPCSEVVHLAGCIGVRMKTSQKEMLQRKIRELCVQGPFLQPSAAKKEASGRSCRADEDGEQGLDLDFAEFLHVFQWMTDCNFCNINDVAERFVQKSWRRPSI
ncbi:CPK4 [Symbiodinium necroappetens]|uniref:CPK4 protein n=1 Tax=Symbiodinium necroappetens TaxID=1628268 RepID=A0A812TYR8_9DINO|nr:CPK4 [Symbiodinium necroappetens]